MLLAGLIHKMIPAICNNIIPHLPVSSRVLGCEENLYSERWNSRTHPPILPIKVGDALDQSRSVQLRGSERAHQNNEL